MYLFDFLTWNVAILNNVLPLDLACYIMSPLILLFLKSRIRISFLSIVMLSYRVNI